MTKKTVKIKLVKALHLFTIYMMIPRAFDEKKDMRNKTVAETSGKEFHIHCS